MRFLIVFFIFLTFNGCLILNDRGSLTTLLETQGNVPLPSPGPLQEVRVNVKVMLQGPFNPATQIMRGLLQSKALLPITEPYSAMGHVFVNGGGGETVDPAVLTVSGDDGVQDWVVIELRNPSSPAEVLASRAALLLKNGSIVDIDGMNDVLFSNVPHGSYYVLVAHRNHLSVMTQNPVALSNTSQLIDLSRADIATYGNSENRYVFGNIAMMWAGDVNHNQSVMYTGGGNDRDPILFAIGGVIPTNVAYGYRPEDVNLDGEVKYTGSDNDRDIILFNMAGNFNLIRTTGIP